MSDVTLHSVDSVPAQKVRRGHGRRSAPREAGSDLLQLSSRVTHEEARVLAQARSILLKLSGRSGPELTSPNLVREYLKTLLAGQEREFFVLVSVDTRRRVIASEILFAGTLDGSRVYPREVVTCALRHGASAVFISHNHPSSGVAEPSQADELVTARLRSALELVDIRLLDHFVVGNNQVYSFSEAGRL